jgi:hypothetical protein
MTEARHLVIFADAEALLAAAQDLRGTAGLDAHMPFHMPEIEDCLDLPASPVRPIMLASGVVLGAATLALQWYDSVLRYPTDVGGRANAAWPGFGFAVFEMAIFGAAFAGLVAMLVSCRLPRLHDPFFATTRTEAASDDRFYLSLPSDAGPDRLELSRLPGALEVIEVGP